jgi:signal transduction histidine kinase/ligand-binding sensor domain-containing protein
MLRSSSLLPALSLATLLGLAIPAWPLDPHKSLTQYSRAVWTHAEGLPADTVKAIAQTADGYLWVGTDEGLARFDGYEFVTFTKESGALPGDSVETLAAGKDGTLWIGTTDGLSRYRNGKFKILTTRDGLPDNFILSVFEDHKGTLWVAAGSYLSRFENGKFTNYPAERLLPVRRVRRIYETRDLTLLIAGRGGLVKRSGDSFVPVLDVFDGATDQFTSLEDASGNVWIGGTNMTIRTREGQVKTFGADDGLLNSLVRALIEDRDGNIWMGTDAGIARLEHGHVTAYATDGVRTRDRVRCLFEDREGDLWVGMSNGLYRFRDTLFTDYGRSEGLPGDEPTTVLQDRKGQVWVAYQGAGLVAFSETGERVYTKMAGLISNEVFSIREAHNGDLLVMTRAGVSVMRDGKFLNYPRQNGIITVDILEDRRGQVWVAASGGVFQLVGASFRSMVPEIPSGPFWDDSGVALSEAPDGSIWAATAGAGLWRIKAGETRRFTTVDGLGSNRLRSLYQDPDGTLWIGTFGGGLNAFRDGVFTRYTAKDGLLSDNISHIQDDGSGVLWLATTSGICSISKQQLRDFAKGSIHTLSPVNYGAEDGLRSTQCAPGVPVGGGGTRTADGRLWFPTARGLSVIDPTAPRRKEEAPVVRVVAVAVGGQGLDMEKEARIKAGSNHLQFRYAAIHLAAPERVRYEYMLEGLDRDWVAARDRRVIDYNTLGHGTYRFHVRASIPGEAPSESSFGFEILPHFYEQRSFLWLCVLSLIAAVLSFYRLRLRQIRSRFSLVLDERTRIAREIHDTLAQGFFGISSQLDALSLKMNGQNDAAQRHLALARKMARHSITESRRSVMNLRDSTIEDLDLPSALARAASQWAAGSATRIEIQASGPLRTLPEDVEQNTFRIAQEAVTNALRHAHATRILIRVQVLHQRLELTVLDDGRGFEPSGAFAMTNGHYGLLGMRERAEHMGGEMELSSEPAGGTLVKVTVPLPPEVHGGETWKRLISLVKAWRRPLAP